MKTENILDIIFTLLAEKRVTAEELGGRYGISPRTVYRYIDEISTIIPVYTVRGANGGIFLSDDFRLPSTYLTGKEFAVAVAALEAFRKELPQDEINSVINKLKAVNKSARNFQLGSSSLMIDSGSWGATGNYNDKLRILEDCVANRREASIRYRDVEGVVSERNIEPHTLILKQGIWYIYAFCCLRCEFRLFKIGRIEKIKKGERVFERRSVDGIESALSYRDDPSLVEITLELSPSAVSEVEEWLGVECIDRGGCDGRDGRGSLGHDGRSKSEHDNRDDNNRDGRKTIARASIPVNSGLVSKILAFGGRVKVLAPESLAEKVRAAAEETLSQYN